MNTVLAIVLLGAAYASAEAGYLRGGYGGYGYGGYGGHRGYGGYGYYGKRSAEADAKPGCLSRGWLPPWWLWRIWLWRIWWIPWIWWMDTMERDLLKLVLSQDTSEEDMVAMVMVVDMVVMVTAVDTMARGRLKP